MDFLIPNVTDVIDILLVAFLIYRVIQLSRRTGGYQILIGIGILFILYFITSILDLRMMTSFLKVLKDYWIIVFVILFQPEIRSLFIKIVKTHDLRSLFKDTKTSVYSPLLNAVSIMSFRKIGALIVIENQRKLSEYVENGEIIDSRISLKLILTLFNNKTILHDGAVIIRKDRILAAKVVLPLSESIEYTKKLGTRHLAALGITEVSDAFAIVVSEETGRISAARNGQIYTGISIDELAQRIKDETG
ncbi:MAG: diadenylate cyclase CdaA [Candidatus Cloacimonetes bacterium]|nr:diadenylate cyclase CdaA [Candidatus Cloacimonadota bacterium]